MGNQAPLGTGPLWKTPGVHLPGPFRSLVRHLRANGVEADRAYAVAWSQARKWAAAGKPRWMKVVAQLEAARAKARATPNKTSHPREPAMPSCPTCGVDAPAVVQALALAVPPQFAKKAPGKAGPPTTTSPTAAKSTVQVPKGQEEQFKALVARLLKRPGTTREKAEKAAAAILRNRKAPGGAPAAKAS